MTTVALLLGVAVVATLVAALRRALRRPRRLELWELVDRDLRHDGWWTGGDAGHTVTAVRDGARWRVVLARYSGYRLTDSAQATLDSRDEVVEVVRRWTDTP